MSKRGSLISKAMRSELAKTLALLGVTVLGILIFREALTIALDTAYVFHTPISPSMEPTLNVGDLIIVQGVKGIDDVRANPYNGDIIVFRKPHSRNEFIVHRAVGKVRMPNGEVYIITKGDNNFREDPWRVTQDMIIGKVIWRIPLLGYIKIFLSTSVGMSLLIILLLALFIFENLPQKKSS